MWMAGLGVAELVEEELTRFTHKLNCFDVLMFLFRGVIQQVMFANKHRVNFRAE